MVFVDHVVKSIDAQWSKSQSVDDLSGWMLDPIHGGMQFCSWLHI